MSKSLKVIVQSMLTIVLLSVVSVISSCEHNSCDGIDTTPQFIDVISMSAIAAYISSNISVSSNDAVTSNGIELRVTVDSTNYFLFESILTSFIKPANACSPAPPQINQEILDITIISNNDYSVSLPAGSNLNGLFNVVSGVSISEGFPMQLDTYITTNPVISFYGLILQFIDAPEISGEHIFTITLTTTDSDVFVMTTQAITFL